MNLRFILAHINYAQSSGFCRRPPLIMSYQFVLNGVPPKKKGKKEKLRRQKRMAHDSLIKITNMAEETMF